MTRNDMAFAMGLFCIYFGVTEGAVLAGVLGGLTTTVAYILAPRVRIVFTSALPPFANAKKVIERAEQEQEQQP